MMCPGRDLSTAPYYVPPPPASGCPFGTQLPKTHTPPPIATKGSGVVHDPVGSGGGGDEGVGAGAVAVSASGESGGTQPPFTHTQFEAGLIVVQVLGTGADAG